MKRSTTVLLTAALLLTAIINTVNAQNSFKTADVKFYNAGNIISGINSDNKGLMRSSVYFAGKYKITEAQDSLIELLKKSDSSDDRHLLLLSLYNIGTEKSMDAIKKQGLSDEAKKLRHISRLMLLNEGNIVLVNK